jgi:hypothetical protein
VTDFAAWLASRRPAPPADLADGVRRAVTGADSLVGALTAAGGALLDEARARPGRARESAFRLLEADALLTYACEAALETEDPMTALDDILAAVGR